MTALVDLPLAFDRLLARTKKLEKGVRDLQQADKVQLLLAAARIKRVAVNIGPVAIGTTDVTITWPIPFGDDDYYVDFQFLTGSLAIGLLHGTVKAGSRTNSEVVITVSATAAVTVAVLDVLAVRP